MVDYNDRTLMHQYKDMVTMKEKKYMANLGTQGTEVTPVNGTKMMRQMYNEEDEDGTSLTKETQLSTLTESTYREKRLTTAQQMQEILNSKNFRETLAQIVAPQVNNLIEPTVKKINQIETQVGDLHDHVQNNNQWHQQQSI